MARETKQKSTVTEKSKPQTESVKNSFMSIYSDERFRFILSMTLLFTSVAMVLAFISFLFTWKIDQSKFDLGTFQLLFDGETEVENWLGKAGALIARLFIHKWFGIPSFAFIFLIILYAFKLINIELMPFRRTVGYTLFGIIWSSLFLSFLFGADYFYLGGAHGYYLNSWLNALMGKAGTGFLLLISALSFVFFTVENSFLWAKSFFITVKTTKDIKQSFNSANELVKSVAIVNEAVQKKDTEKNVESENETVKRIKSKKEVSIDALNTYELDDDDDLEVSFNQKNVPIDLDTNKPLKVVEQENFLLSDDGRKIDKNLGFEVEDTTVNQANVHVKAEMLDNVLNNRHALEVEKNKDIEGQTLGNLPDYDPTLELSSFKLPTIELLSEHGTGISEVTNEELISNKNKIVETLANYKIEITKIKATIGPTITLYEIIPAPGVRISKIKNLEDDIALSLSALGIRIIAPMPGRGTIGIEVPNQKPEVVSMRSLITSSKFQESPMEIPIALGKTISNESYVFDLTKMPHLLVAGATGQGKSVGLNAIIASILYKKHPSQVKLVLVDPKKVELTLYEKIERFYLAKLPDMEEPIITDNQKVIHTLNSLNVEMDNRYNMLKEAQVRNIKEYNEKFVARRLNPEKGHKYLPYIVLIIDEFADLIMTAGKEVELPIARLAQLARAIGIHLIVATQRPSTNIITGVIKANFPTRIAFKVASMIDSRTILDSPGANQLIGRGDMLITQGSDLIRLQCAFIDTPELERITNYIGSQRGYPSAFLLPEPDIAGSDNNSDVDLTQRDDLFDDAARIVVVHQQGSTSLIQRKLSIGYNRAGRIIDQLEAAGIVGPFEGSKARQVNFHDEYSLEQLLNSLR